MGVFDKLLQMFGKKSSVEYQPIGTSRWKIFFQKSFPKEMIPSNRTGSFLGSIFIVVIVMSLFNFPLNDFLKGNLNVTVEVGFPWSFLVFDLLNPTVSPLRIKEFIWSVILYLFVAYLIEVSINYIMSLDIFKSKKEKNEKPRFFKDVNDNLAGKLTKGIFGGPKSVKKDTVLKDEKTPTVKSNESSNVKTSLTQTEANKGSSSGFENSSGNLNKSNGQKILSQSSKPLEGVRKVPTAVSKKSSLVGGNSAPIKKLSVVNMAKPSSTQLSESASVQKVLPKSSINQSAQAKQLKLSTVQTAKPQPKLPVQQKRVVPVKAIEDKKKKKVSYEND